MTSIDHLGTLLASHVVLWHVVYSSYLALWCSVIDNMSSMNHLGTLLASHVLLGEVKIQLLRDLLTVRLSIDLEEDIHFKQVTDVIYRI